MKSMRISFNPFLKQPIADFCQLERISLTAQQLIVAKIALAIFSAISAVYLCLKLDALRRRVTVIEADGNQYSSQIQEVTGTCTVIFNGYFASQATAEGEFLNGQLNGQGKIIFPYGTILEEQGEFLNGWLIEGKMTYRDGKKEEGEFNKNSLNGKGSRIHSDGKIEKGNFTDGKLTIPAI